MIALLSAVYTLAGRVMTAVKFGVDLASASSDDSVSPYVRKDASATGRAIDREQAHLQVPRPLKHPERLILVALGCRAAHVHKTERLAVGRQERLCGRDRVLALVQVGILRGELRYPARCISEAPARVRSVLD
jgi:hypothetical protein